MQRHALIIVALVATTLIPAVAVARVTRLEIDRQEPFAAGMPFGASGPY
ncbi:MAG: hypothetical protein GY722_18315, partial [bacterium]|nr:hypothetical protein [bacterium]